MNPKVSIVMTCYNRELFLAQAIESILAQTFSDFELVIWDDGSTDASPLIAAQYAAKDDRIRVEATTHQGRIPSLSAALALTSGEYMGWVDSDDLLAPEALVATVSLLDRQKDVGLVYTDYLNIDEHGRVLGYGKRCRIPYSPHALLQNFMTFHFRIFRRTTFECVRGLDHAVPMAEDYDFCLRASEVTRIGRIKKPLYRYRNHQNQLSTKRRLDQIHGAKQAIQAALVRRGLASQFRVHMEIKGSYQIRRIES